MLEFLGLYVTCHVGIFSSCILFWLIISIIMWDFSSEILFHPTMIRFVAVVSLLASGVVTLNKYLILGVG